MRARRSFLATILSLLMIPLFGAEKPVDVSAVIPKDEAEKILGESVRNPTPLNINGKDGYYSKCNYYSTKSVRSLLLRVRQASAGTLDALNELDQIAGAGAKMKIIEGLGDKAGMLDGVPENGLPPNAIILYVAKGKSFITIGISRIADEQTALEKAEEVAQKILAQL
ncbi:MAG: hypothetical protein DMF04_03750 [Verrucomicrobia bacterium]|nr:MAG: hypothetical protein DMF04_03750 [Verrucomicrobiota bacterium]